MLAIVVGGLEDWRAGEVLQQRRAQRSQRDESILYCERWPRLRFSYTSFVTPICYARFSLTRLEWLARLARLHGWGD